ncbi:TOBE domain-containing protein [Nocardioides sp. B-3]|uniref:TOBE domain-containing protein n=1 Tax=Nocardioides sp. B-3 TaxID=2895565 RepID=UPI0021526A6E|nr:TOBE domain-containing protein [Nocardioides sp. B-3]UUZ58060.1 TOBE domain-containing protein [Nocardioides sp. B-3]
MLRDGRLIRAGSPADVYLTPHDPELARFVGGATSLEGRTGEGRAATCALGTVTLTHPAAADALVLVIRPDPVVLDPGGVEAHVDEVSFYGHDAALRLTAGSTALVARVPGPSAPAAGDTVRIRVQGRRTRLPGSRPRLRPRSGASDGGR